MNYCIKVRGEVDMIKICFIYPQRSSSVGSLCVKWKDSESVDCNLANEFSDTGATATAHKELLELQFIPANG